jgi:hypothetical protein
MLKQALSELQPQGSFLLWGLFVWEGIFVVDIVVVLDFIYFMCKYTVVVFRHTRRGHQIPLQMVVSHHVVAGN